MIFLITLVCGVWCAWRCSRQGFIALWAHLFNALISIYAGIMLYPTLYRFLPVSMQTSWAQLVGLIAVAGLTFGVTHHLVNLHLNGAFRLATPAPFEKFGSPILAFLVGYTLSGFVLFAAGTLPLVRYSLTGYSSVDFNECRSNVLFTCDLVGGLSRQTVDGPRSNRRVIDALVDGRYCLGALEEKW